MNNKPSALSKVEVPTRDDLMLPSPAAIPRHCGHNWDDPAFRAHHSKAQVLKSESVGKKYAMVSGGAASRGNALPNVTSASAARLHGSLQGAAGASASVKEGGSGTPLSPASGTVPSWSQGSGANSSGIENIDLIADNVALSTNRYDLSGRKLTFKAWFSERVPESPIEKVRVRFVVVSFFLEDETVAVFEPTIPSSGLQGGYLLRRCKAPLTETNAARRAPPPTDRSRFRDLSLISEKHITILDFNVARPILIFGTDYHLHSCDSFTRSLLTALGVDVPEDTDAPHDASFEGYRRKMAGNAGATLPTSARLDPLRGSAITKATKQRVENSGIVLRFYAAWDEETTHTNEHREHRFEFHYFMEDDTVSLRERESTATGGEVIARHFLKRMKLPRSGNAAEMIDSKSASADPECYKPTDFDVGSVVNAFGRKLLLVDADDATRAYYSKRWGITLADPIIVSTKKPVPPPVVKAASTDLALLGLEPPRAKSTQILKYELLLDNPETSDDALRRFVLTFFAGDGEIAIGELVQRNSGFHGGRVLKKQVLRDPKSGKQIGLPDLVEGAVLRVYGRNFRISRLSPRAEAVAKNMEDLEQDEAATHAAKGVTKERLRQLINTFREHVMGRYVTLAEAFRVFDQDSDGRLTEFELRMFLAKHDISRSEAEAVALIHAFDPDGDGLITFQQFVQGCTYGVNVNADVSGEEIAALEAQCRARAGFQALTVAHRSLLDRLRAKLEVRHLSVAEMFRHMSTMPRKWPEVMPPEEYARNGARVTLNALTNAEKDCVVTPVQFRRVLVERIGMNISKEEMAVLLSCFYPDLPESEFESAEDVDALPPRALRLEDMHRILTNNLRK